MLLHVPCKEVDAITFVKGLQERHEISEVSNPEHCGCFFYIFVKQVTCYTLNRSKHYENAV